MIVDLALWFLWSSLLSFFVVFLMKYRVPARANYWFMITQGVVIIIQGVLPLILFMARHDYILDNMGVFFSVFLIMFSVPLLWPYWAGYRWVKKRKGESFARRYFFMKSSGRYY